jgi:hypothetical protein
MCIKHIDPNNGSADGSVYGYDRKRCNFIIWGIAGDKIVIDRVEHDETETKCGSMEATRRDAQAVAKRENELPNSFLRRAIAGAMHP